MGRWSLIGALSPAVLFGYRRLAGTNATQHCTKFFSEKHEKMASSRHLCFFGERATPFFILPDNAKQQNTVLTGAKHLFQKHGIDRPSYSCLARFFFATMLGFTALTAHAEVNVRSFLPHVQASPKRIEELLQTKDLKSACDATCQRKTKSLFGNTSTKTQPLDKKSLRIIAQATKHPVQQSGIEISDPCANGACMETLETKKAYQALTELSAAVGGRKRGLDTKTGEAVLFSGKSVQCSEGSLKYRNCCVRKGWGLGLDLTKCKQSEKRLAKARTEGRAIKVGRFCAHHSAFILGACNSHHQTWCVFPSKLARIVQEQGRFWQLHIPFGLARTPNCRGLKPSEYQRLDFSHIDLKPAYQDTQVRINAIPLANTIEREGTTSAKKRRNRNA